MNKASEPILELLQDAGVVMTPGGIEYELNRQLGDDAPGHSTIFRALDDLEKYGMIRRPEGGSLVELTDTGRGFLSGHVDASQLEPDA